MSETYDIKFDDSPVGKAQMEKKGLYMLFSCRCRLPEDGLYRIHVICGEKRTDLGICIPKDSAFGMDKKVPVKHIGDGTPTFLLLPKDWKPRPVPEEKAAPEESSPEDEMKQEEEAILPDLEETALQTVDAESFIPVSAEEHFDHLDKLENARMEIRDDTPGIVISMEEKV